MNTNVDTNLELFLSIVEDIEKPCEHDQHESVPSEHQGKGVWYVTSKACPNCDRQGYTKLICDRFVKQAIFGGNLFYCPACDEDLGYGMDNFESVVRKG